MPFWASFNYAYFAEILNDLGALTPAGSEDDLTPIPYYSQLQKYQIFEVSFSQSFIVSLSICERNIMIKSKLLMT